MKALSTWQDAPANTTTLLHLPLVASSLRVAFERSDTVVVLGNSDAVVVYDRGVLLVEILQGGEVLVYRQQTYQTQRIATVNTVFAWIGMQERVREYSTSSWSAGEAHFQTHVLLAHPNALARLNLQG